MRFAKGIPAVCLALALGACGGPRIIPDRELALIFHDIYLVNSYVKQNDIRVDTLNIYEPVLAQYGYTSEDVQYTIGNFSKRKSARLSEDVVEVAAEMLRRESSHYRRRVEIRDTIALVARARFADTVYTAGRIRVRRVADTARLRVVIPDVREGSYDVSYSYWLDSLDDNGSIRAGATLFDEAGQRSGVGPTRRLVHGERQRVHFSLNSTADHRRLELTLGGYPEDLSAPRLDIDSLVVTRHLPDDEAVARLSRDWFDWRRLDTLIKRDETHLGPPFADARGSGAR